MINQDDLPKLLLALDFQKDGSLYSKSFDSSNAVMSVDLAKKELHYDLIVLNYLKIAITLVDFIDCGSVIPQLTIPKIKNIKIPLPPLQTQTLIVEACKVVDAEVNKAL